MLSLDKLNAESEKAAQLERRINSDIVLQIAHVVESMLAAREKVAREFKLFASSVAQAQRQAAEMMLTIAEKVGPALRQAEEMRRLVEPYRHNFNSVGRPAMPTCRAFEELQAWPAEPPRRSIVRRELKRRPGFGAFNE
jgi:hypothetical protein